LRFAIFDFRFEERRHLRFAIDGRDFKLQIANRKWEKLQI